MLFAYHNLTDAELVSAVLAQEHPTEYEMELVDRIARLETKVEDLENDLEQANSLILQGGGVIN